MGGLLTPPTTLGERERSTPVHLQRTAHAPRWGGRRRHNRPPTLLAVQFNTVVAAAAVEAGVVGVVRRGRLRGHLVWRRRRHHSSNVDDEPLSNDEICEYYAIRDTYDYAILLGLVVHCR